MELFSSFKSDIYRYVFPDRMAEERVPLFRNFVVSGMIQLQTYVESYKLVNLNFFNKVDSTDECGASILQGPRGEIGAVFAFRPDCRCEKYHYEGVSLEKMSCLLEQCKCSTTTPTCVPCGTANTGNVTIDPYCGYMLQGDVACLPPYKTPPEDDRCFKVADRYFAIGPQHKLWLYPRFPCGYVIGITWKGIRRTYLDTDYVFDDEDLKDAIAAYVESEVASRVDNDPQRADRVYRQYRLKAQDIIYREENDLKPRARHICVEGLDTSDLLQIYPDNPYPVCVGEICVTDLQQVFRVTGSPEGVTTSLTDAAIAYDPNTGNMWIFGGIASGNTGWILLISA